MDICHLPEWQLFACHRGFLHGNIVGMNTSRDRRWGLTQQAIAERIGVGRATVCKWQRRRLPAERVAAVEEVTGIPRHLLRPDLFEAAG
jgi:hypothetical protein